MPHRRNPVNHKASKKASQNSPPAMAANQLNHFLPRHVRGKKYSARVGAKLFLTKKRELFAR